MSPAAPSIATDRDSAAKVAPATEPAERVTVAKEDPAMARLSGRCVDAAGAPLAGCTVALSGWSSGRESEAQWLRDHEALPKPMDLPRVVTKEDGRFSFSFVPPPPFQFSLECARDDMGTVGSWSYSFTAGIDPLGIGFPTDVAFEGTFTEVGFETVELYDGTFFEAYHVRNIFSEAADLFGTPFNVTGTVDSWYVKGLGLVKETIVNDADGAVVLDRTLMGYYGGLSPE